MSAVAVIAAGGSGRRFGSTVAKQYLTVGKLPMLVHTLRAFEGAQSISDVIVTLPQTDVASWEAELRNHHRIRKLKKVVAGGETRQASVYNGLRAVEGNPQYVAVHDAARCLVTSELIDGTVNACRDPWQGAIAALPVRDTIKQVEGEKILKTQPRDALWAMQTPQVFQYSFIREAYEKAQASGFQATDDAAVAEHAGGAIRVVEGSARNFKVTHPEDIALAEKLLNSDSKGLALRIGQGIDIHPFVQGRKLVLGGIEIPSSKGLKGHSDADALIHAICDALLGALALGDIGKHFPDNNPEFKDRSSIYFLTKIVELIRESRWNVANVDSTIVTEEPILQPYIEPMRTKLAQTMNISIDQLSIKATRPEKLGSLGRGEGLAAYATVLLTR